ncbi:MAG: hypothetical protein EPO07_20540 [Verrucomicrobia bacterium]|nr:MAG: hypothetical protein EPO07_20540 [Verrucomicrobiota bacterium]
MNVRSLPVGIQNLLLGAMLLAASARSHAQCCPPVITNQPASQVVLQSATVNFSVAVSSATYATYQWRLNGANLPGATSSNYTIVNVQAWQAGNYSVAVTNAAGYAISSNALLTVNVSSGVPGAWGYGGLDETTVPLGTSNITAISAGSFHSLALKSGGTVLAWGDHIFGETSVPGSVSNVAGIAAGGFYSTATHSNGTVTAWGDASYGLMDTPPGLSNVVSVAGGNLHALALLKDGTVTAWGDNSYDNTNVPAGLGDVVAVAAGGYHSLALKADGTVIAWGQNSDGQTNVPVWLNSVVAIAGGGNHSLALKRDGTVTVWGGNNYNQTNVPAGLNNVVAIAGGGYHSLALRRDGVITAWGYNAYSQTNVPAGLATNMIAIASHGDHNLALKGSGAPVITVNPFSRTVNVGSNVTFSVKAAGNNNLTYQWRFYGTNLTGQTSPNFTRSSAQTSQAGPYSVVVSNSSGSVTSTIAMLTVINNSVLLTPLGYNTSGFRLRITGTPGTYVIEISPDVTHWSGWLTTNVPGSGTLDVLDPAVINVDQRYYRAYLQ